REDGDQADNDSTDEPLTDELHEDAIGREVLLDVNRGSDRNDRLPHELVAAADPEAVFHVDEVVDRAECAHADERTDGDDRLRDVAVALALREEEPDERPQDRDDDDEERPAHRRYALLREVSARSLAPEVLTDAGLSEELDGGESEDEPQKGRGKHRAQGNDRRRQPVRAARRPQRLAAG